MMEVDVAKCNYCGACVGSCPKNCIFLNEVKVEINEDECIRCGFCIRVCPVGAISADWWSE